MVMRRVENGLKRISHMLYTLFLVALRTRPRIDWLLSDQTVRLGTQEETQGMPCCLRLLYLPCISTLRPEHSLRLRSACSSCRADVLRNQGDGSPICGYNQPLLYCLSRIIYWSWHRLAIYAASGKPRP
jgi:hypothetical protein